MKAIRVSILSSFLLLLPCNAASLVKTDSDEPAPQLQFIPDYGTTSEGSQAAVQQSTLLKVLSSKLDNPSQASLSRILKKTDHVRVLAGGEYNGKPLSKNILLDSRSAATIAELKQALLIDEDPESLGRDMCYGDPTLELMSGKRVLAVLGFHHGRSIRWDKSWKFDASLQDGRRLVEWFAANGIEGPKQAQEHEIKERRRGVADLQKWMMSMPDCLRPYLGEMLSPSMADILIFLPEPSPADELREDSRNRTHDSPRQKQLMAVLDESYKDQNDKVLALLQWYASGTGQWTGFPTYEELPAELLLGVPTKQIIEGLGAKDVSEPELEGAARFFASPTFRHAKPHDLTMLDTKLKKRLLEHCMKSSDDDKRKRAENAFGKASLMQSADNRADLQ
jgi:hypothetical protein